MLYVKIPKDRIGVLIGRNGEVKRKIEAETGAKIKIDSEDGEVSIDDSNIKDVMYSVKVVDIVKAIGRGFSPQRTFKLLNDDVYFVSLDIRDYVGKRQKHIRRIKSRIIGSQGKTRKTIETLAGVDISIYGETVGIIGNWEDLEIAKVAVEMLLRGSEHSSAYKYLERKKKER